MHKRTLAILCFSFLCTLIFLWVSQWFFTICFETNDDVLFSMLIHGYGIASHSTAFLPASNTLIAHIAQHIPGIASMPGYVVLSVFLLFTALWGILFFLLYLGVSLFISVPIFVIIALRAVLLPQFSVTAGLLTVAAILCLYGYLKEKKSVILLSVLFFAFFGYLLRSQEFFIVVFISLPLLPWNNILNVRRELFLTGCVFVSVVSISWVVDERDRNSETLSEYTEFLNTMIPIWNYGAGNHLRERIDIIEKYNYSENDIALLVSYFYMTHQLTDSKTIQAMLDELGATYKQKNSLFLGGEAVKALLHKELLPLLCVGLLFIVALPLNKYQRMRIIAAWLCMVGLLFMIGAMGRPGRLRIYFPLISMMAVAPLALLHLASVKKRSTHVFLSFAVTVSVLWSASYIVPIVSKNRNINAQLRVAISKFPTDEPIYSWGSAFPYEYVYPLFRDNGWLSSYDIPLFGGYTSAPFSSTKQKDIKGEGFLQQLQSLQGVLTLERGNRCEKLMSQFAKEHLNCTVMCKRELSLDLSLDPYRSTVGLYRAWCR
jgi:hypothetical protein